MRIISLRVGGVPGARYENIKGETLQLQLTVVSHYGEKSAQLSDFITMLQDNLARSLGSAFRPYALEQVHGTIIGLEGELTEQGILSRWFKENTNDERYISPDRLLEFIRSTEIKDFDVKIGGWLPNKDYGFTSRGQHPFMRSFSIQNDIAVAMGWPIHCAKHSDSLYNLRASFEKANARHKWHKDGYKDNDFFFVLGRINTERIRHSDLERTETKMRHILSKYEKIVRIGKNTMALVAYLDAELPLTTSVPFMINDEQLTPDTINSLFI